MESQAIVSNSPIILSDDSVEREVLEELAYRRENERYRYYVPNGKVEEFINLVGTKCFVSLFSAANGVGKTAGGANMLANLFWPGENPWFNTGVFKKWPYLKKGRIIADPKTVEKTIVPELHHWFPRGRYNAIKNSRNFDSVWTTDTGWEFDIMTYEQDPKEFESSTLGFVWCDEPPPEAIYKASIARLRRGGLLFITETPLMGSAWIYDQIYTQPKPGIREVVEAGVEANCKIHGTRGILEHEDIVKMLENYDEDEKLARAFGKFQHLTGLVFKSFNRKIHVIEPFYLDPREWCVYQRFDSHPRTEDAIGYYAVNSQGLKIICDEIWINPLDDQDLVAKIKAKDSQYRIVDRALEPAGFNEDQHDSKHLSLAKKLLRAGLKYRPASKERMAAVRRTKDALSFRSVGDRMIKPPEMYAFSNCVRHIYEFEHWQWADWSGKMAERRSLSEKPRDKDDHMMENVGRFLIDEPKYIEPVYEDNVTSVQATVPDLY